MLQEEGMVVVTGELCYIAEDLLFLMLWVHSIKNDHTCLRFTTVAAQYYRCRMKTLDFSSVLLVNS
jgi:hypothetical protein